MWRVEQTTWQEGPGTVSLGPGFGFDVLDGDGHPAGVIYVGQATQRTPPGPTTATVEAALGRELGLEAALDEGGAWLVEGDVLIGLGDDWTDERTTDWTPVQLAGRAIFDLEEADVPTVLVESFGELRSARGKAARKIATRGTELSNSGYPLATVLHTSNGWRLADLHTTLHLGELAGHQTSPSSWLTTLQQDPLLPADVGSATLALGTRYVDRPRGT